MSTSTNVHHRKIDLQSTHDLTYLQRNILNAARRKLDLHFPPGAAVREGDGNGNGTGTGTGEDVLRGAVERDVRAVSGCGFEQLVFAGRRVGMGWETRLNVNVKRGSGSRKESVGVGWLADYWHWHWRGKQFVAQTLLYAKRNVTINGLDVPLPPPPPAPSSSTSRATRSNAHHLSSSLDPTAEDAMEGIQTEEEIEYEPYDPRLATKLQSLYLSLEAETTAVAKMRRDVPAKAAALWKEAYAYTIETEAEVQREEEAVKVELEGDLFGTLGLEGGERWEGMRDVYGRACEGLVGLKGGMTETVGRCERAERVADVVERG
ncbi:hypothetical protein MMC16_001405 [Acarospora aff. strigata]|nr:hypothetical protein [Acarospora aff. strigata]